ncbi:MAG: ComF family protein [Legionellales bacterium]|nr:ComF family protein [Legionellales bacterium]
MSLFKGLAKILFPHTCVLCAERSDQSRDMCIECEKKLPWTHSVCKQCGLHLPSGTDTDICGHCQQKTPQFDRVLALCDYADPIDRLITAAKFNQKLVYTRLLGELLAKQVTQKWYQSQPMPSLIVPVPLHDARIKARGYNQSVEIAKIVSKKLHLPFSFDICKRNKATLAQSGLTHAEREKNMKNAFTLRSTSIASHVAIIDDIVTTGHTVGELSKQLRAAGVKQIDVWCCARTQRDKG